MAKGSLNFFELHFEKILAGLAVVVLIYLGVTYIATSPNTVEHNGEQLKPSDVNDKILAEARELETKVKNATVATNAAPPVKYAEVVAQQWKEGVLGAGAVPRVLPALAVRGSPMPAIENTAVTELGDKPVALVKPLAPSLPAAATGRSMAVRRAMKIGEKVEKPAGGREGEAPAPTGESIELPWVSVAAYFDTAAQKDEMIKANYATPNANPYITGIDVERQELLANGAWSDWKPVEGVKAMPKFDVPAPVIDDVSGQLLNALDINRAFRTVKDDQLHLAQPRFEELYQVTAGDKWTIPPVEGYQSQGEDEEGEKPIPAPHPTPKEPPKKAEPPKREPEPGPGGGAPGRDPRNPGQPPGPKPTDPKKEGQKKATEDLKDARAAFAKKDYPAAKEKCEAVTSNEYATAAQKHQAETILEEIRKIETGPTVAELPAPPEIWTKPDEPNKIGLLYHDDSVQSGKTYRYRLRVKLWNRYAGYPRNVQKPEDAKQTLIAGEWSLPSDPITVTPTTYFFVKGGNKPNAAIDLYKWRKGEWVKQSFEVEVGDVIGGPKKVGSETVDFTTGAVVLDVRWDESVRVRLAGEKGSFKDSMKPSVVLVYMDPADGQVKEKVALFDLYDPMYKRLKGKS